MALDRAFSHKQPGADLAVGDTHHEQTQNLPLLRGQRRLAYRRPEVAWHGDLPRQRRLDRGSKGRLELIGEDQAVDPAVQRSADGASVGRLADSDNQQLAELDFNCLNDSQSSEQSVW